MRVSVSADSSNTTIDGLDEDLNYFVQVSASTRAGGGVVSSQHVARFSQGSSGVVGGVVGGVVAVVLIIAVTVVVLAVLLVVARKIRSKQNKVKQTE